MRTEFKKCTVDMYPIFLKIANEAFEKSDPKWFPENYGHIYPFAGDELADADVDNNYLSFFDGKPSGTIGIYPIKILCGEKIISCAGIGAVGVAPEFRNLGIMDFMMNEAMKIIKNENYDLSWLVGERLRYKRFGYDLGGKTLAIEMNKKSFSDGFFAENEKIKTPGIEDVEILDRLYKQYTNRVLRERRLWERQICRKNLVWKLVNDDAYLVYNVDSPQNVLELAGDSKNVKNLLSNHFKTFNLSILSISMPYESNNTIQKLLEVSSGYKLNPCDQFALFRKNSCIDFSEIRYCNDIFDSNGNSSGLPLYISPIDKV